MDDDKNNTQCNPCLCVLQIQSNFRRHRTKRNVIAYAVTFHISVAKIQNWLRLYRAKRIFRNRMHELRVMREIRLSGRLLFEKSVFFTIYDEVSNWCIVIIIALLCNVCVFI